MSAHEHMHGEEAPAQKRVANDGYKPTTVNMCAFVIAVLVRIYVL